MRGPRVQQYLLYSNSHLNIIVYVIKLCCDLAVFLLRINKKKIHLITPGSCSDEDTSLKPPDREKKKSINSVGWNLCMWPERDPRCFHVLCQKNNTLTKGKNLPWSVVYLQMLSYTQLFWTEKPVTSCSTSLVTLTWSQTHLQKEKKRDTHTQKNDKKISVLVYICTWQM